MFNTEAVDVEDGNAVAGLFPVGTRVWFPFPPEVKNVPNPIGFEGVAGVLFDFCPSPDTFPGSERKENAKM